MKLQQDLREFVALLNSHEAEFLVVGGHAVAFHGHPRFTGDIDFLIRPSVENATRVLAALQAFAFGDLALSVDDFIKPGNVVQLGSRRRRKAQGGCSRASSAWLTRCCNGRRPLALCATYGLRR